MRRLLRRLWYYLTRTRHQAELNEELQHHLALAAAEAEAWCDPGRSQARSAAPGGPSDRVSDNTRDEIRMPRLSIAQDVRYALRGLARQPLHTLAAVLTLGLGIGATTAIASVLASVLYTPLPFERPDRLVQVWEHNIPRDNPTNVVSPANYLDWRDRNSSFSDMALYTFGGLTLIEDKPEALDGMYVSWNMLALLGVKPLLGRDFTAEDGAQGAPRPLLLRYQTWQRIFPPIRASWDERCESAKVKRWWVSCRKARAVSPARATASGMARTGRHGGSRRPPGPARTLWDGARPAQGRGDAGAGPG
jgi:hypothetical protein